MKKNFLIIIILISCIKIDAYATDKIIATTSSPPEYLKNDLLNFKKELEEKFIPKTEVVLLINGESGSEENSLNGLRRGRSNITFISVGAIAAITPEISLLSLPFIFSSNQEADFILDRYLLEYFKKKLPSKNLNIIRWVDSGWSIIYSKDKINNPYDLNKYRMRSSSSIASRMFLELFKTDTVQLPFAEVIPALQTGLIDGGTTSILMYHIAGIYEYAPYLILTNHALNPGAVIVNNTWYQSLNSKNKLLIDKSFPTSKTLRQKHRTVECITEKEIMKFKIDITKNISSEWKGNIKKLHKNIIDKTSGNAEEVYNIILKGKKEFLLIKEDIKNDCI